MKMEVGLQDLMPGMQDHDDTELAAQVVAAKLKEGIAGGAKQQAEQEAFVAKDQRVELVWQGHHGVEVGGGQKLRPPCLDPVGLGYGLTLGTVTIAARVVGVAFKAALWTLLGVATQLSRATGHDGVDHLVLCRRNRVGLPIAVAVEAKNVGNFPLGRLGCRGRVVRVDTAPHNRHPLTPLQERDWPRESRVSPGGCGCWPVAGG